MQPVKNIWDLAWYSFVGVPVPLKISYGWFPYSLAPPNVPWSFFVTPLRLTTAHMVSWVARVLRRWIAAKSLRWKWSRRTPRFCEAELLERACKNESTYFGCAKLIKKVSILKYVKFFYREERAVSIPGRNLPLSSYVSGIPISWYCARQSQGS